MLFTALKNLDLFLRNDVMKLAPQPKNDPFPIVNNGPNMTHFPSFLDLYGFCKNKIWSEC